jgi:nitric oxide reductase activation protein
MIGAVLATACSVRLSGGQMFPTQTIPQGGRQIPGMPPPGRNGNPAEPDPMDPHRAERADQQEKLRNNDRQKRLVADTEKLLVLATDLKAQVDKSTKDTLSVDVIKKADEIEKLARSVKERMKG